MREKDIKSALHQYECACNLLMCAVNDRFFNGLADPYWVGDDVGEIADFYSGFLTATDMYYLLKSDATDKDLQYYFEELAIHGEGILKFLKDKHLI